jgi:transposase
LALRHYLSFFILLSGGVCHEFFVGVDVSKEKFDACCIDEQGEKLFSLMCSMNREGFEKFISRLPEDKSSFLVGMESSASYHIKYVIDFQIIRT